MSDGTVPLTVRGETLILHPQRAVLWPRCRTVIVADTHFGKSSFFARHGIAVPAGSDESDRQRLTDLIKSTDARRLIILGDFLHAPLTPNSLDADDLYHWADRLAGFLEIHVVAGNHDIGAQKSHLSAVRWWDSQWIDPPFRFIHDAERVPRPNDEAPFTLSGHIHPVLRLRELGKGALRVPVFWQRAGGLILPSFGLFTGGYSIVPGEGERMYAVGSSGVVPVG
jgi:DNA ligase-associated metallophosphoesterase